MSLLLPCTPVSVSLIGVSSVKSQKLLQNKISFLFWAHAIVMMIAWKICFDLKDFTKVPKYINMQTDNMKELQYFWHLLVNLWVCHSQLHAIKHLCTIADPFSGHEIFSLKFDLNSHLILPSYILQSHNKNYTHSFSISKQMCQLTLHCTCKYHICATLARKSHTITIETYR